MTRELIETPLSRTRKNILELFEEMGESPISGISQAAIDRGLVEADVLAVCQRRGVSEFVRKVLKTVLPTGLPFAKPLNGEDEESAPWKQLTLFTYDQWCDLIRRESAALLADFDQVRLLRGECLRRFGRAPEIPELALVNEAA